MKKMTNSAAKAATGVILLIEGGEIVRGGGRLAGEREGAGNQERILSGSHQGAEMRPV